MEFWFEAVNCFYKLDFSDRKKRWVCLVCGHRLTTDPGMYRHVGKKHFDIVKSHFNTCKE